jgi:dolichol-phosphate mannosyltransferase
MDEQSQFFPATQSDRYRPVELAVVIPTFNERDNIIPLLRRLAVALNGVGWEAIFVDDDSPDGTANFVREIAQKNSHVRLIHELVDAVSRALCRRRATSSALFFLRNRC